ncbi:hypothetical protein Purlil1_4461 [Purpureocillium lilacinum]|uniref:Uncharacterized protein n=1 Tax=Purpureocillium lilacinum TaxID=33203 RepID=A0ABR0C537_PURLI|nr:hypothetical protein Purlil1_4461 [Purpureocillium lilacinum]
MSTGAIRQRARYGTDPATAGGRRVVAVNPEMRQTNRPLAAFGVARPSKALASQTSSGQPVWGQAATSRVLASGLRNACEDGFSEVSWRTWGWGDGAWGSCRRLYCKFTSKRGSRPEHLQVPSGGQGYDTAHRRKPQISGRSERQRRIWSMRPGTNGSARSDDVRICPPGTAIVAPLGRACSSAKRAGLPSLASVGNGHERCKARADNEKPRSRGCLRAV